MIKNRIYKVSAYLSTVDTTQIVRATVVLGVFLFTLFHPEMVIAGPATSGVGS